MTYRIINADVLDGLRQLEDESVHCVVTSPPFWGLRDYGTGSWEGGDEACDHKVGRFTTPVSDKQMSNAGSGDTRARVTCPKCGASRVDQQLGLEPVLDCWIEGPGSPRCGNCYICGMLAVFREVRRVLRDDGVLFLELGDTYEGGGRGGNPIQSAGRVQATNVGSFVNPSPPQPGLKSKDLCGMPWRMAMALQADGWWLRSDVIWWKPAPMPESVNGTRYERHQVADRSQDDTLEWIDCPGCAQCCEHDGYVLRMSAGRPTKSHSYVFVLTRSPTYYWDSEALREPSIHAGKVSKMGPKTLSKGQSTAMGRKPSGSALNESMIVSPGRNIRSVWRIPTESFSEAHFATFAQELARRCIAAGTSERGCCGACGAPWVRVVRNAGVLKLETLGELARTTPVRRDCGISRTTTIDWFPSCSCSAQAVPCVVLDPFSGAATTLLVAAQMGRDAVGIELSAEYCRMGRERIERALRPQTSRTDEVVEGLFTGTLL